MQEFDRNLSGTTGANPDAAWRESVRLAVARYRGTRHDQRGYVRFKLRLDPVYRLICRRLGRTGSVVDLGTGFGILPVLLAVRRQAGEIAGVEWDESKLAAARIAAAGLPGVTLHAADARAFPLPPADAICLVDLLHYYPMNEQRALLAKAATALRPGGWLVIRETSGRRGGGASWTRLFERGSVRLGWNRGPGVVYRESGDLVADLAALGCDCTLEDASSALHRGNTLIWARKRG